MEELAFCSKSPGIGGRIKDSAEDFMVEEILPDGTVLEINKEREKQGEPGKFIQFVLQKRDWSTPYAIREIAKHLHASPKRFSYAGMKDKSAVTAQLISAQGFDRNAILGIRIKDMSINGAWYASDKVRLGQLAGNRFTIRVRDAVKNPDEAVAKIHEELGGMFPNYFGEQRFGSVSRNTHILGEKIIRGEFEQAAMAFLTDYESENNPESRSARAELLKTQDFKTALNSYPKHLRFERTMIAYLADNPRDFIGALKQLPRQTLLLFVHAFQSHLFNQLLSERIREGNGQVDMEEGEYLCPVDSFGFPVLDKMGLEGFLCMKILGYNSNPNERERAILEKHGMTKDQFKIKEIPEISSKGTFRTAFAPLVGFSFKDNTFRFYLQSGAYATSALREFMEERK